MILALASIYTNSSTLVLTIMLNTIIVIKVVDIVRRFFFHMFIKACRTNRYMRAIF